MKNYSLRALCSLTFLCLCTLLGTAATTDYGAPVSTPNLEGDSLQLVHFIKETKQEINAVRNTYDARNLSLRAALWHTELALQKPQEKSAAEQVELLQKKISLQESLQENEAFLETNTLKVRYRKGVDLIKLLYEKILALDHHFTGMQTYQNVILLSNPHTYPEFNKAQAVMERNMKKKNSVMLPNILQSNPFLSATFSVVGTLVGDGTSSQKQKELDNMSCILDFTVRMNSDLSVIQHETEYLRTANKNLKDECEKLFADYTKVIDYFVPLENCRQQDDWESLRERLDFFSGQLEPNNSSNDSGQSDYGNGGYGSNNYGNQSSNTYGNSSGYNSNSNSGYGSSTYGNSNSNSGGYNSGGYGNSNSTSSNYGNSYGNSGYGSGQSSYGNSNSSGYGNQQSSYGNNNSNTPPQASQGSSKMSPREAERKRVDLEFATQRVAEFITKYNNFITQGTQYYQKFDNIVSTYANEDACETKLPRQFGDLKYDIKSTIEKFTNTYNLPEIQGSRLKDLLYGSVDR